MTVSPRERVNRIRRAAVRFANDYGPLPDANNGNVDALHEVATRLYKILREEGLDIISADKSSWPKDATQ